MTMVETPAHRGGRGDHGRPESALSPDDDPVGALILRVARNDRAAFRELHASSSAKLFGIALRMLSHRGEAEDALQEVFVRVWSRAHRFDPARARGMTWLIAVMRNHCIDRLRARPDLVEDDAVLAQMPGPGVTPEAAAIAAGEARRIADCMARLDADRAAAVRGAYLDGQSYEALSRRFGVPMNTMRSWLRRGLMKLKECLAE